MTLKVLDDDATGTDTNHEKSWFRDYAAVVRKEPRIDPAESRDDFLEVARLLGTVEAPRRPSKI
jgi:hypothetical protein